jgi:lauroyl/myristoyl acyltransferase
VFEESAFVNMQALGFWFVRIIILTLQSLPLMTCVWLGRGIGTLAFLIPSSPRRTAISNLTHVYGAKLEGPAIRRLARQTFQCIGENMVASIKTASMTNEALDNHLEFRGLEQIRDLVADSPSGRALVAIGHFGNFEMLARCRFLLEGFRFGTTYRGLNQKWLDRNLMLLRNGSGCHFFERRKESAALRAFLNEGKAMVGIFMDQHGGNNGYRGDFLGRECTTNPAVAIYAQRYECSLFTLFCFRESPGKWVVELGREVPTLVDGQRRQLPDIVSDLNDDFEKAVLRDPTNWFWVHNRWKEIRSRDRARKEKLRSSGVTGASTKH